MYLNSRGASSVSRTCGDSRWLPTERSGVVERAVELDERIKRTDALIDELVYELYGLTDEEIEIVEDAVGE